MCKITGSLREAGYVGVRVCWWVWVSRVLEGACVWVFARAGGCVRAGGWVRVLLRVRVRNA